MMSEKTPREHITDIDDAAASGASADDVDTTDDDGTPVENPSG